MSMSKMVLCSSWFSDRAWRVFEDDVIKISAIAKLPVVSVGVKAKTI